MRRGHPHNELCPQSNVFLLDTSLVFISISVFIFHLKGFFPMTSPFYIIPMFVLLSAGPGGSPPCPWVP